MKEMKSATDADVGNIEAWAEIIGHIMHEVPHDRRAAVLHLVSKNEKIEEAKRAKNGLRPIPLNEFMEGYDKSPGFHHWNSIMRLKALMIQVFVREIVNNHSKEDASKIIFAQQMHGTGSGLLVDYLVDLPGYRKTVRAKA